MPQGRPLRHHVVAPPADPRPNCCPPAPRRRFLQSSSSRSSPSPPSSSSSSSSAAAARLAPPPPAAEREATEAEGSPPSDGAPPPGCCPPTSSPASACKGRVVQKTRSRKGSAEQEDRVRQQHRAMLLRTHPLQLHRCILPHVFQVRLLLLARKNALLDRHGRSDRPALKRPC